MNPKENKSLKAIKDIDSRLQVIRQNVIGNEDSNQLSHAINNKILPISNLHTTNSKQVIYADYDNGSIIRLYDVNTGECIHENSWNPCSRKFEGFISGTPFLLIRKVEEGIMRGYTINNSFSYRVATGHKGIVNDALSVYKEKMIVTCGSDGEAYVYSCYDWRSLGKLDSCTTSPANAITEIPFNKNVAIGYSNGEVRIFSLYTYQLINTIQQTYDSIISITATSAFICFATRSKIYIHKISGEYVSTINSPFTISIIKCGMGDVIDQCNTPLSSNDFYDPFLNELVFVGTVRGLVLVYNILNCELIYTIEGHDLEITSLMLSPRKDVFTGCIDGAIRRFDFLMKRCLNIYYKFDGCRSLSVSKDHKYICISGIADCRAKLINRETGKIIKEVKHQNSIRYSLFTNVLGKDYLITGGWDGQVKQWSLEPCQLVNTYKAQGRVCDLQMLDRKRLLIAFYELKGLGGVKIVDLETGKIMLTDFCHKFKREARVVALNATDKYFFSVGDDGMLYVRDLQSMQLVNKSNFAAGIRAITVSEDGNHLYLGLDNSGMVEITVPDWKQNFIEVPMNGYAISLCFQKNMLYIGTEYGDVVKYNTSSNHVVWSDKIHDRRIWQVHLIDDGDTLVSVSEDGVIKFTKSSTGELLGSYLNIFRGFLWTTPGAENVRKDYYWTDRKDLINISEGKTNQKKLNVFVDHKLIDEYNSIYNNQKVVMSRINNSQYHKYFELSLKQVNQKMSVDKLLQHNFNRLLAG